MSGTENKGKLYTSRHYRRLAHDYTLSELHKVFIKVHKRKTIKLKNLREAASLQLSYNTADEAVENVVVQDRSFVEIPVTLPSTSCSINTNNSIDKSCSKVQQSEKDIIDDFSYFYSNSELSDGLENEYEESSNRYENQILDDINQSNNLLNKSLNADESLDQSKEDNNNLKFKLDLQDWAIAYKIHLNAFSALQSILRKYTGIDFPKDARTFLKTPKCTNVSSMENGQYCHLELRNAIERILTKQCDRKCDEDKIRLLVCTDGAPIGHSSTKNLWPIMCCDTILKIVEVIGIYYGDIKSDDSNKFLEQFVNEAVNLINNGILYNEKHYKVRIHGIICDAPAKSYILKVKNHTGYDSCTKCLVHGEYINDTICFSAEIDALILRNDMDFRRFAYQDGYQKGQTILRQIPHFGLVSKVPLDYMHLVCLGVMRKLLMLWLTGPLQIRLPSRTVTIISNHLELFRKNVPTDFARKPRVLNYIKLWKATEFRQFLLYISPVILKDILRKDVYFNFLTLHVAITILVNPNVLRTPHYIIYANELLKYFVKSYENIYGKKYVSFNIHNLLHLTDDVKQFGSLDTFSAFPFGNYISSLKNLIRKGEKPLQQICRRLEEYNYITSYMLKHEYHKQFTKKHRDGPITNEHDYKNDYKQYKVLRNGNLYINCDSENNDCVILKDGSIIAVSNFATTEKESYVIGQQLDVVRNLHELPCTSELIGIKVVTINNCMKSWLCEEINAKAYKIRYGSEIIIFPILHTTN